MSAGTSSLGLGSEFGCVGDHMSAQALRGLGAEKALSEYLLNEATPVFKVSFQDTALWNFVSECRWMGRGRSGSPDVPLGTVRAGLKGQTAQRAVAQRVGVLCNASGSHS